MSEFNFQSLLEVVDRLGASDIHLVPNYPVTIRVDGELRAVGEELVSTEIINSLLNQILSDVSKATLEAQYSADFGITLGNGWRARCNVYRTNGEPALALRLIPEEIKSLDDLGAPDEMKSIAELTHGLVLVTGTTGSGKSTTLAALIDHINVNRSAHIVTIENPIEFLHKGKKSLVTQRDVGIDTLTFADGLRDSLREDPDVILVGECRDYETMALALRAAETGHLVLTTLHTASSAQAIDRFIDAFPSEEKNVARSLLSNTLRVVTNQQLFKRTGGGRIAAYEILKVNTAVHNLIREDRTDQIVSIMQTGTSSGMQTLQRSLEGLIAEGLVEGKGSKSFFSR